MLSILDAIPENSPLPTRLALTYIGLVLEFVEVFLLTGTGLPVSFLISTSGRLEIATVPVIVHGEVPWYTVEVVGKFVTAKLVLLIVSVLLTNTVEVKLVTVTDVGKLSTRTVDVKLLTVTVPVIAGKLLTATVPLTAGIEAMFTVEVKLLVITVPVIAGKLATFTVDVKFVTVTLPFTVTVPVTAGKLLIATVPDTAGIEAMFTVLVKLVTVTLVGKLLTATVPVIAGRLAMFTVDVKLLTITCPLVPMLTVQVPS